LPVLAGDAAFGGRRHRRGAQKTRSRTEQGFLEVAGLVVVAHIPVMLIEVILTVFLVLFLKKVQSDIFPDRQIIQP